MLFNKAGYWERLFPIACHCAPWPVNTKAIRGITALDDRMTGGRLEILSRRSHTLEETAYDFQGSVVLLELSVKASSLIKEGVVVCLVAR